MKLKQKKIMVNTQYLVAELNQFISEALGYDTQHSFWYYSNGYYDAIMFNKIVVWDSENYEATPTLKSIKYEFKKYIDEISKIKIK